MNPLEGLIATLAKVPGVGKKSAARIVFYLLKADRGFVASLGQQIVELRQRIKKCPICGNFTEMEPCQVCSDPTRDQRVICVVEGVQDLMSLQSTGEYRGLYHVLHGVIAPMDGVGPEALGLDKLVGRVKAEGVEEVIIATNPTMEGDTTALYIKKMLVNHNVKVTRLAQGLPVGGDLEYADRQTVARSFRARTELE